MKFTSVSLHTMDSDFSGGWIYVLMSSADYDRFKVGRTSDNPLVRFKTLRTGDPSLGLETAYFIPTRTEKLSIVEAEIHSRLADDRIAFHDEADSEWFRGSAKQACEWLEVMFSAWWGQPVVDTYLLGQGRVCRAYESDLENLYKRVASRSVVGSPRSS